MTPIFGPVPSRRFGLSLGIDLSPSTKRCNFDCLYCELAAAPAVTTVKEAPEPEEIARALREGLKRHPETEVITLTANGEPTLYPRLNELISLIEPLKGERKTLILSNGSTASDPAVRKALARLDMVKFSLDCATKRCFKRLDRPHASVSLSNVIEGIRAFRKGYDGFMVLEILVVKGINDKPEEIEALNRVLKTLNADRIDLGTVDRPPAYPVDPISYEALYEIARRFDSTLPIHIVTRSAPAEAGSELDETQLLQTLAKRPLTEEDLKALFGPQTLQRFHQLLLAGKIVSKRVGRLTFYGTAFNLQKEKKTHRNP